MSEKMVKGVSLILKAWFDLARLQLHWATDPPLSIKAISFLLEKAQWQRDKYHWKSCQSLRGEEENRKKKKRRSIIWELLPEALFCGGGKRFDSFDGIEMNKYNSLLKILLQSLTSFLKSSFVNFPSLVRWSRIVFQSGLPANGKKIYNQRINVIFEELERMSYLSCSAARSNFWTGACVEGV